MKKFRFKLEAYYRIKKLEEQQSLAHLAEVVGQVDRETAEVQNYFSESRRFVQTQREEMLRGRFDNDYQRMLQRYFYVLDQKRKIAERRIEELQEELQKRQELVKQARMRRRTVEILREKRMKEHADLVNKMESAALDEFNSKKSKKELYI